MDLICRNMTSRIDEKHMPRAHDFSRRFVVSNLVCGELHPVVSHFHVSAKTVYVLVFLLGIGAEGDDFTGILQFQRNGGLFLRQ